MSGIELLHWWNLVFLVPGAIGAMLGLMAMMGVGGHDADHDAGPGDVNGDHDVAHDLDHDADHDLDQDHDLHHEVEHQVHPALDHAPEVEQSLAAHDGAHAHHAGAAPGGWVSTALSLLGFGPVPFGLSLISLMLFFALFGLGANAGLDRFLPWILPLNVAAALGGSAFVTRWVGRILGKLAPKQETHAGTFAGLVGCSGTVVSLLSPTEGYAQVRDRFGNMQEVRCLSSSGKPLGRDLPILVVEARTADRSVLVVENELETRIRWARPFASQTDGPSGMQPDQPQSRPQPPPQPQSKLQQDPSSAEAPAPARKAKEGQP